VEWAVPQALCGLQSETDPAEHASSETDPAEHASLLVGVAENRQDDKLSTASSLSAAAYPSQERKLFLCLAMLELTGCLLSLLSSR
jgi:hypothetical protein